MIQSKRIGVLEFREASYVGNKPPFVSYDIVKWYPNPYYGNEKNYIKLNHEFYCYPNNTGCRVHKDLFKSKELCIVLATFRYESQEECYNLEFIGDRPLELSNWVNFKELIKYGFEQLNPKWYEE